MRRTGVSPSGATAVVLALFVTHQTLNDGAVRYGLRQARTLHHWQKGKVTAQ